MRPRRLVFADKPTGKDGNENEKDEKPKPIVNSHNLREVMLDLVKERKINDSDVSKALEVIKEGNPDDKEKLIKLVQEGVDGNLSATTFSKFVKEALEKPKDEKDEKKVMDEVKKKISEQTGEAASTSEQMLDSFKANKKNQNNPIVEKMQHLHNDFKRLNEDDLKFRKPIKKKLDEMIKQNQISPEDAQKLYNLDFNKEGVQDKWDEISKNFKDPKVKSELEDIHKLKKEEALNDKKLELEYAQKTKEFRELANSIADQMYDQYAKDQALKVMQRSAGLPIKAGQKLVYKGLEGFDGPELKYTKEDAVIKEITFKDIEIKNEKGEVIKKVPSNTPIITVETIDAVTKQPKQEDMSLSGLHTWINQQDVTEDLETQANLEESIGHKIKEGDILEYRQLLDAAGGIYSTEDKQVTIKKIDEAKKQIELSEGVILTPGTHKEDKILSFGQFAKWFKRNESLPFIEDLKKLRELLVADNQIRNELGKRNAAHYRPIEVKPDEVLWYDNHPEKTFVIKEASDQKITLTNGESFTPAAFLRWVKRNEVEKKDPEAQAAQQTQNIQDDNERVKEKELLQAQHESENKNRVLQGMVANDNSKFQMVSTEEAPPPSPSYLRKLWDDTTFLSLDDFWEMGKTIFEFGKRKMERWQKGRVGRTGETMFMKLGGWLGSNTVGKIFEEMGGDFKGNAEHAEHEEVNHHVEHMKTWGIDDIKHELHNAPNKDILRAAIQVLTEKGELRWDDPGLIDSINRLSNGLPRWVRSGQNSLEDIEAVLDEWWGESTTKEFRSKQDSSYNNIKNGWKDQAGRLESDPEGLKGALQRILAKHLKGEYVSAAQYEEYLHYAIEAGKMTFEDKIFFLMMGIGADAGSGLGGHGHGHGHHPMTLLHLDRVGAIESALLNHFPIIDFFTAGDHIQLDANGKMVPEREENGDLKRDENGNLIPKKGKPTVNNFKMWMSEYVTKYSSLETMTDPHKCDWNAKHFTNFLWDHIVWNQAARNRMEKAVSDPSRWDHEDYPIFATMLSEQAVEQIVQKLSGAKQQASFVALENAIAGFNEVTNVKLTRIKQNIVENKDQAKKDIFDLVNVLRTFIRFDAIVDTRYHHREGYTRLGDHELKRKPLVDPSRATGQHRDEIRALIGGLAKRLGIEEIWNAQVLKKLSAAPDQRDAQAQQNIVAEFGKLLEDKMGRKTSEELAQMFEDVQEENKKRKSSAFGKTLNVKGILDKQQKRKEADLDETKETFELVKYTPEEIKNKVDDIRRAREKLGMLGDRSKEEIKQAEATRLTEIMRQVDDGNYMPQPEDPTILDAELGDLRNQIAVKERGVAPPGEPPSNDNRNANDRDRRRAA